MRRERERWGHEEKGRGSPAMELAGTYVRQNTNEHLDGKEKLPGKKFIIGLG